MGSRACEDGQPKKDFEVLFWRAFASEGSSGRGRVGGGEAGDDRSRRLLVVIRVLVPVPCESSE